VIVELYELHSLRHPTHPTRKLPLPLRKLLPDPLRSLEDLQRFTHGDIAEMTTAARHAEAFRWRVVVSQIDAEVVPAYVLERIARLEAA